MCCRGVVPVRGLSHLQTNNLARRPSGAAFFMEIFMSEAKKPVPVRLVYDVWFRDDERTPAGAVVSVSLEEAKALIVAGKAERADPLPGE